MQYFPLSKDGKGYVKIEKNIMNNFFETSSVIRWPVKYREQERTSCHLATPSPQRGEGIRAVFQCIALVQ